MTLKDKIETLAENQGWNDQTLLGLIVDFVDADRRGKMLMWYLEDVAKDENKGSDMNETDDNDSGTMAANSALVSLEESKRECPFYAAAIKAIDEDQQIIHDVAAEQMQVVDNVKHMGWFRDAVANEVELRHYQWVDEAKKAIAARNKLVVRFCEKRHLDLDDVQHDTSFINEIVEELKLNQTITNAFAYANGGGKLYEDGVEVPGKLEELAREALDDLAQLGKEFDEPPSEERRQEVYQERVDSGLSPAEAAGSAWPDNEDDESLLRRELAEMDANPVGAEPGGPDDNHGLSQTALVLLFRANLLRTALHQSDKNLEAREQEFNRLKKTTEELSAIHTTTAAMLTETQAALRQAKRTISAHRKLIAKAATTVSKNMLKRKTLLALAAELTKAIAKPAKKKKS